MVNNVSNLKFSNFSYQVSPSQMNLKTMEPPEKEALVFDSVNFMSKSKEKDSYKLLSLTRLNLIYKMAEQISDGIALFLGEKAKTLAV